MEKKKCTKCKIEKELTEFSKDKRSKDGLQCKCKSCAKESNKEWQDRNKEYNKEWRDRNKDKVKEYNREWRDQNIEYNKEYYQNNKNRLKKYYKEYKRERLKDPLYKMKCNLRNRTSQAFKNKGYSKDTKTQEMLGVDFQVAKKHIERQFTKGMNWNNQGEWHIDHVIPLASANTEEEIKKLCHYTNLQPLWAQDNLSKKDKVQFTQIKIRI
jgi:hypothetical protein